MKDNEVKNSALHGMDAISKTIKITDVAPPEKSSESKTLGNTDGFGDPPDDKGLGL